jgi:cyclophilin family peptidyl-prolyl cis-trans isomerase
MARLSSASCPGFMAQFGMSAYPEVSKAWETANIKDDPVVQSNHRGFVSFAMAGPNTRTTQVFINYGNNERWTASGFSRSAWSRTAWKWWTSCITATEKARRTDTARIRA